MYSIIFTYFGLGFSLALPLIIRQWLGEWLPGNRWSFQFALLEMLIGLPAMIVGIYGWPKCKNFAKATPVLLCVGLAFLSLLWVDKTEIRRTTMWLYRLTAVILCASALGFSSKLWVVAAKAYIIGVFSATIMIFIMGFNGFEGYASVLLDYNHIINRNSSSIMVGMSILLAFICMYRGHFIFPQSLFYILGIAFFFVLLVAGASRTAIVGVVGAVTMMLWFSGKSNKITAILASFVPVVAAVILIAPSSFLHVCERFTKSDIYTANHRTELWSMGVSGMLKDPSLVLLGCGIGGVDKMLGREVVTCEGIINKRTSNNIVVVNSHSLVVEYLFTFGLLGIVPGLFCIKKIFAQGLRQEMSTRSGYYVPLIVFAGLISITGQILATHIIIVVGSLVLASLNKSFVNDTSQTPHSGNTLSDSTICRTHSSCYKKQHPESISN